jgi:alpha-glucosidase (family GH31 glycosyl hydrolase)
VEKKMTFKHWKLILLTAFLFTVHISILRAQGGIYHATFSDGERYLTIELLDDDLAHFQLSATDPADTAIYTTPMVLKTDYTGATSVNLPDANTLETPEMRIVVDGLCVTVTDLLREVLLTSLCPQPADDRTSGFTFTQEGTTDIYGLGEQFIRRGGTDGNWMGQQRLALNAYGNAMTRYNGGFTGNAQFPIMYALGEGTDNYALFLDDLYQQLWDFTADPFSLTTTNNVVRWYIMTGENLPDLRRDYMELSGRPPVPPRQMFGLWVSEYGYENWGELMTILESLRAANFPVDGFVLDLLWFGGIAPDSYMGALTWDEENFPDAASFIANLREAYGVGIMTIEESYVDESIADYSDLSAQNILVRDCPETECAPIEMNSWWGVGGMVDWTNPDSAAWWHDNRRQPLIDDGVMGHWTDLGEPENYNEGAWYYGFPELDLHAHADVHNIYNFMWAQSIWQGYQRNNVQQRPFIMSRSGTSGIQRFGASMWSGDIGANFASLAPQMQVQMQMSLSGIDYFGSDIGGFYRQVIDADINEIYTVWLANSVLIDVPLRPHTNNTRELYETAPSLIGDVASNLVNVRLRYQLSPYLYTLAHLAYREGESVFAPLVYYYQDDPNVRTIGSQKMIGADMMMATITTAGAETVPVYLPAGGWFNYYTNEYFESSGEWIDAPTTIDGVLRAPLFVRDGAIIPQMLVDDQTMNTLGMRRDGSESTLILSAYHATEGGSFTLIEDDGATITYQNGDVRETVVRLSQQGESWVVEVGASTGTYANAPEQRSVEIYLISPDGLVSQTGEISVNESQSFVFAP